jgi:predicted molibdopterin-dependent oxidoreductase YjgC
MIRVIINGMEIKANEGRTLLETARASGIDIPSLCDYPGLEPFTGCRLCLVEVKGRRGYVPACSTIAEEGLEVRTATPELVALRRQILELILAEHPNACLICAEKLSCDDHKSTIRKTGEVTGCVLCPANGRCQLQRVVEAIGLDRVHFPSDRREGEVRRDDPFIDRDNSLCILCGRCVRVCSEVRGASVLTFVSRGSRTVVGAAMDRRLFESACRFCGACVDVCPTGSLSERAVRYDRMPETEKPTLCPFCGQGCRLKVGVRQGRVIGAVPDADGAANRGQACVKGRFLVKHVVHHPLRLLRPMVRRDGRLKEVPWEEALDEAAKRLKGYSAGQIGVAASGQSSCEDLFVLHRFAHEVLKAQTFAAPWRCSAAAGLRELGRAAGQTVPLNIRISDIGLMRTIVLFGEDLPVTQPIVGLEVHRALRSGAVLLSIVTGGQRSATRATIKLALPAGKEEAFLSALAAAILKISNVPSLRAEGFDGFKAHLRSLDIAKVLRSLDIPKEKLNEISRLLMPGKPPVFFFGPEFAAADGRKNLAALWNLALLAGGRLIPLDVESNIRGGLALSDAFPTKTTPAGELAEAAARKDIRAFYLAGPFPKLEPNAAEFVIIQGSYNDENAAIADILLPETTSFESEATLVNIEGRIQISEGAVDPQGDARPGWSILAALAAKVGAAGFGYGSAADVREDIARSVPAFASVAMPDGRGEELFLAEKTREPVRFIDITAVSGVGEKKARPFLPGPDVYKGLDLARDNKSLRLVRGR